jgi:hypothetical protein
VAVAIECHVDRSVTHNGLEALGRPAKVFDERAGGGVPEHVEAIARLASVSGKSALDLERHPTPRMNVRHSFDVATGIRENEIEIALWTIRPPLPKRVHHHRRQGNVTHPGFGFRRTNLEPSVRSLANVDLTGIEIDIAPT